MILGVEHLALSCKNVRVGAQVLNEIGYQIKFIQENLPNHPTKKTLLNTYEPLHAIAYGQAEHSVSVELTQHAGLSCNTVSPYQVLFNKPPGQIFPLSEKLSFSHMEKFYGVALGAIQPVTGYWEPFHAQIWYNSLPSSSPIFIRAVLVPVADLSVSERFWILGLGCRKVEHGAIETGHRWARLVFPSPVPTWSLTVVLAEDQAERNPRYLDDAGFSCLALITNRISEDSRTAITMGGKTLSDQFDLQIDNRKLKIVLLRGPDHELIEMIEFQRI